MTHTPLPTSDHDLKVLLTDASLDAPRVDLWGRLEDQIAGVSRRRRPAFRAFQAVAAALVMLIAGGAMLAVFSLAQDERGQPATLDGAVNDLLLVHGYNAATQNNTLDAFLPQSRELRSILESVRIWEPVIARDGRQIVYGGLQERDGTWSATVWVLNADSLVLEWTLNLPLSAGDDASDDPSFDVSVAITADTVYITTHRWSDVAPIALQAIDREDGAQTGSWQIDTGGLQSDGGDLFVSPDEQRLVLVADVWEGDFAYGVNARTATFTFALPDMREIGRTVPTEGNFPRWEAQPTPDGTALYTTGVFGQGEPLKVRFFDLATGTMAQEIEIGDSFSGLVQHGISHDGTLLYAFDPVDARLAIVNLRERTLVRSVSVDMSLVQGDGPSALARVLGALRGLVVQDAAAKVYIQGTMQLSPDGSRLYAVGIAGDAINGSPSGVLVIDTASWQVIDHWLPEINPTEMILGGDGSTLYLTTVDWGSQTSVTRLRAIDTSSGEEIFQTESFDAGLTFSLAEVYRNVWGVTPPVIASGLEVAGRESIDSATPFARLDISVTDNARVTGETVSVEARFINPTSGALVREDGRGVRFDAPDHVRAVLSRPGGTGDDTITIVLTAGEDGVYRGAARLAKAGTWSLEVIAERDREPSRHATIPAAVIVQPALTGTDGRQYALDLTTDPVDPTVDANVALTLRVVDAETGATLPDGVDLEAGLPDELKVSFYQVERGVFSHTLTRTGHATFTGSVSFFAAGEWTTTVGLLVPGSSRGIGAGVVVVR